MLRMRWLGGVRRGSLILCVTQTSALAFIYLVALLAMA